MAHPEDSVTQEQIDLWTEANLANITRALEIQRIKGMSRYGDSSLYDLNTRSRSEMPLCHMWTDLLSSYETIDPPPGYTVIQGSVRAIFAEERTPSPRSHRFAIGPNNTVLCFTAGQFILPHTPALLPETRVNLLKQTAPHLVHIYSNGVARLHGEVGEITRLLGLKFLHFDPHAGTGTPQRNMAANISVG